MRPKMQEKDDDKEQGVTQTNVWFKHKNVALLGR